MRSPFACLVCLSLALGCTAKSPPANEAEPEIMIPTGALVVLGEDATIYREREDVLGVPLPKRPDVGTRSVAVEVLAVADARLEVRTLGPDHPPTCAGNFEFADDYELRFWVERADLRQVLGAPASFAFSDETRIELRPGVPVIDSVSGELGIGGQSLFVPLEDAQLTWTFEPAPASPSSGRIQFLRNNIPLHYGERSLVGAVAPFLRASDVLEPKAESESERSLVFDNACGRFTLRVSADAIHDIYAMKGPKDAIPRMARNFDPEMAARNAEILDLMPRTQTFRGSPYGAELFEPLPTGECTPVRWTIASGMTLSWAQSDGPAGTVRRAHQLPANAREVGKRVCFELEGLSLCADASKLARVVDPNCPGD